MHIANMQNMYIFNIKFDFEIKFDFKRSPKRLNIQNMWALEL